MMSAVQRLASTSLDMPLQFEDQTGALQLETNGLYFQTPCCAYWHCDSAAKCLGAQGPAYKHKRSHLMPQKPQAKNWQPPYTLLPPIGSTNAASTSTGVTIMSLMSIDCLRRRYVQQQLRSTGVFAPQ
jgi:hypothetical protein